MGLRQTELTSDQTGENIDRRVYVITSDDYGDVCVVAAQNAYQAAAFALDALDSGDISSDAVRRMLATGWPREDQISELRTDIDAAVVLSGGGAD